MSEEVDAALSALRAALAGAADVPREVVGVAEKAATLPDAVVFAAFTAFLAMAGGLAICSVIPGLSPVAVFGAFPVAVALIGDCMGIGAFGGVLLHRWFRAQRGLPDPNAVIQRLEPWLKLLRRNEISPDVREGIQGVIRMELERAGMRPREQAPLLEATPLPDGCREVALHDASPSDRRRGEADRPPGR